ncbi:solute carrier family 35 member G3-like [Discoglossus pictus]
MSESSSPSGYFLLVPYLPNTPLLTPHDKNHSPSPPPPPPQIPWWRCHLSNNMKGLLVALFGGGLPAGFVAPFSRIANEMSGIPSLEILLIRCLIHYFFYIYIRYRNLPLFGPPGTWRRLLPHALASVFSIACAYSSFLVVPTGSAATVRKGSSTVCSTLLALCLEQEPLTGYNWLGLVGSILGLAIILLPCMLNKHIELWDIIGYALAWLSGMFLALGLVIFRKMDFESKIVTVALMFGIVGSLFCAPTMCLLQTPVIPQDYLTWTCLANICALAMTSFLCTSYAVTKLHPALVCALLHSEVVVTISVQYYVLKEAVNPYEIIGAGVIIGSISVITAQNVSWGTDE